MFDSKYSFNYFRMIGLPLKSGFEVTTAEWRSACHPCSGRASCEVAVPPLAVCKIC